MLVYVFFSSFDMSHMTGEPQAHERTHLFRLMFIAGPANAFNAVLFFRTTYPYFLSHCSWFFDFTRIRNTLECSANHEYFVVVEAS